MFVALIDQNEFAGQLEAANDIDDFNQRLLAMLDSLGFSDYAIVRRTRRRGLDIPFCSMPKELMATYQIKKYYQYDMVLDYIDAGNLDPIYLSMVSRVIERAPLLTETFKQNLQIMALYQRFDVNDMYLIPVKSNSHNPDDRILFSVVSKGVDQEAFLQIVNRCKAVLQTLAETVNIIAEPRFYPSESGQIINPGPLRLLTVMAKKNLSLSQAAKRLRISIDTANKHMALAKKALGTNSQANAVYRAVKRGLIEL